MTEAEELRSEYSAGKLDGIKRDLSSFLVNNREAIAKFKEEAAKMRRGIVADDTAIKLFILQLRSINPTDEIKSQLKEVENEIWYSAEKQRDAQPDRIAVAREWCRRHAPGWRDHRVMAIIYVFDVNKEHYLRIFRDGAPAC
jgi:hypothetical protein